MSKSSAKKNIISVIGIIIMLAVLGFILFKSPRTDVQTGFAPVEIKGSSILVNDQDQINEVKMNATLKKPGFITIHRTMSDAPAEIIGTSQYLKPDEYSGLVIPVDADMLPGFRYVALLHVDNGDKRYTILDDYPVKSDDVIVKDYFIAIPDAERTEFPGQETVEIQR